MLGTCQECQGRTIGDEVGEGGRVPITEAKHAWVSGLELGGGELSQGQVCV
jgi:hypothetical protein